jgi:hypothetical protein
MTKASRFFLARQIACVETLAAEMKRKNTRKWHLKGSPAFLDAAILQVAGRKE